jgi:hypothetical protein
MNALDNALLDLFKIYSFPFLWFVNTFYPKGISYLSWDEWVPVSALTVYFVYLLVLPLLLLMAFLTYLHDPEDPNEQRIEIFSKLTIAIMIFPFFTPFLMLLYATVF